jgi:IclR family transcriptional regulator, acetate operon repressor
MKSMDHPAAIAGMSMFPPPVAKRATSGPVTDLLQAQVHVEHDLSQDCLDKNHDASSGSAVMRAMSILEAISQHQDAPQLADICRLVDLPKATVYRILTTLEHAGYVTKEPGSKSYTCGTQLFRLAGNALMRSPNRAARHAIIEELVEQIGEACNLAVPSVSSVIYLDRIEASGPQNLPLHVGSSVPLYASACGKLFLSYMNRKNRERFVRTTPMVKYTKKTLHVPSALLAELEQIRVRGFAIDDEEYMPGIRCIAVPVQTDDGTVVAAIAAQAPVGRMSVEQAHEYLPHLRDAADAISATIDWQ